MRKSEAEGLSCAAVAELMSIRPSEAGRTGVLGQAAIASCMVALILLSSFVALDDFAEAKIDGLFERALASFALARMLNGVISVVQGTEVALQPAGVGVTLTPGEILDPVNDLVEHFSWIMLAATVSLGMQEVLLDFGQWWVVRALIGAIGIVWLLAWLARRRTRSARPGAFEGLAFRVLAVALFLRFAVPLVAILNDLAYDAFLDTRHARSVAAIESAGAELMQSAETNAETEGADSGTVASVFGRALSSAREQLDLKRRIEAIEQRAANLVTHIIRLSVVFILQTVVFPVLFLWALTIPLAGVKYTESRKRH